MVKFPTVKGFVNEQLFIYFGKKIKTFENFQQKLLLQNATFQIIQLTVTFSECFSQILKVVHTNQCLGGYVRTYVLLLWMSVKPTAVTMSVEGTPNLRCFPKDKL